MKEEVNAPGCAQERDLVAFLYDELTDVESETFQRHLQQCSACSEQLAAFRNVRASVIAWRNESLGVVFPAVANNSPLPIVVQREASALAALKEFFNLSPFWMKGAVAFASLLFCLFAVMAVARWREAPQAPVANNANGKMYTKQEVDALVAQRVQEEVERVKRQVPDTSTVGANASPKNPRKKAASEGSEVAKVASGPKARRPLTRIEREQLAADLRLISSMNEPELELLSEKINQ